MSSMAVAEQKKRNAPIWLKVLLGLHILAITSWSLPPPPNDLLQGRRQLGIESGNPVGSASRSVNEGLLLFNERYVKTSPIKQYVLCTGFWQYWDMFAPNPSDTDYYGTAEVTFQDGTLRVYDYPRIYRMPIPAKYLNERYRKFFERAHSDTYRYVWPPFAQRVAQIVWTEKGNPPIKVRLIRHWQRVVRPGKPQPSEYQEFAYYDHQVDVAALRGPGQ